MDDAQDNRKVGTVLARIGGALWVVFAVIFASSDEGGGANIGAGFIALLALVTSLVAACLLFSAARSAGVRVAAAVAVAAEVAYLALAVDDSGTRGLVVAVIAVIVLALASAALLTARATRPTR
jgi:multisubunit Na+/H+ antiporter MnhG subunit